VAVIIFNYSGIFLGYFSLKIYLWVAEARKLLMFSALNGVCRSLAVG